MTFKSSDEIRTHIFSEIRKKAGNIHIHLAVTPNGRARLSIGTHINIKDFINQRDALQWLIHSYNLKHIKNILTSCPHHSVRKDQEPEMSKPRKMDEAAKTIFEKISSIDYYTTEMYRSILGDLDTLKMSIPLSESEVGYVIEIIMDKMHKLLDETLDHGRYQVYKKYHDQLRDKRRTTL